MSARPKWAYSNSNYYLLGPVIERVSGLPYLSYVTAHILGKAEAGCGAPFPIVAPAASPAASATAQAK